MRGEEEQQQWRRQQCPAELMQERESRAETGTPAPLCPPQPPIDDAPSTGALPASLASSRSLYQSLVVAGVTLAAETDADRKPQPLLRSAS